MSERSRRVALGALLVLALGVRLLVQRDASDAETTYWPIIDAEAYLLQALRVPAGEDIADGVYFQAPGYALLLGTVYAAAGVPGALEAHSDRDLDPEHVRHAARVGRALNVVLGLLTVLLVYRLGCRLWSPGTGLVAAALAAVYAPFLFYEAHLLKVSLSLVFLPWAVLAALRAERLGSARAWLWCGVALGLGAWVRGNMHLVTAGACVLLVLFGVPGWPRRRAVAGAAALLLGVALAMAPLVVRNSLVLGRPVFSTAAGGTAFYLCNNPHNTTGLIQYLDFNRQVPRHEERDWKARAEAEVGRTLEAGELSRFWLGKAFEGIADAPGRWLLAETRKLGLLFSRYEAPDNTQLAFGERTSPILRWTPSRYGVVLPFALLGLWLGGRARLSGGDRRFGLAALAAGWGLYAASLLPFIVTSRFRMPLVPLVLVAAGRGVLGLLRGIDASDRRGAAIVLVGGGLLSLASEGPLGPLDARERDSHLAMRLINRAAVALERGELDAVRADLTEALELHAGALGAWTMLARLERAEANARAAAGATRAELEASRERVRAMLRDRVLAYSADHAAAWRELGLLEYDAGRWGEAIAALERARTLWPGDRIARQYLALAALEAGVPEDAIPHAEWLVSDDPGSDEGHGLLALALAAVGRHDEAAAAVGAYDRAAARRRAAGLLPLLPDQPAFERYRP